MAVSPGKLIDPGGCAACSIELKVPPGTQGREPRLAIAQSWERMPHDATTRDLKTHARWTSGDTWQVYTHDHDAWDNQTRIELPGQGVITASFDSDLHTYLNKRLLPPLRRPSAHQPLHQHGRHESPPDAIRDIGGTSTKNWRVSIGGARPR
ncbi:hypothetical protein [Myxococcus faecalis]|uniref:hypothetical protein n=1 Tax=Myxococcus faecalis TaxID=3115646 RepID=UPI003CED4A23